MEKNNLKNINNLNIWYYDTLLDLQDLFFKLKEKSIELNFDEEEANTFNMLVEIWGSDLNCLNSFEKIISIYNMHSVIYNKFRQFPIFKSYIYKLYYLSKYLTNSKMYI